MFGDPGAQRRGRSHLPVNSTPLKLTLHPDRLAICRLAPDATLPAWVLHEGARFWSITRTPDELSIVCDEDDLPPSVHDHVVRGWRAFVVEGPIPFGLTGIVAGLTTPLATAGIPVFVLSTYDTDRVLVEEEHLERARAVLAKAHEVHEA